MANCPVAPSHAKVFPCSSGVIGQQALSRSTPLRSEFAVLASHGGAGLACVLGRRAIVSNIPERNRT